MHILFIVNPISGLGLGKELPEKIRRIPEYDSIPYDIVFTEYAGHARKLVEDARQEGKCQCFLPEKAACGRNSHSINCRLCAKQLKRGLLCERCL